MKRFHNAWIVLRPHMIEENLLLSQCMFVYQSQKKKCLKERSSYDESLIKKDCLRAWVLSPIMKMPNNIFATNEYVHNLQMVFEKIKDAINVLQQK